MNHLTVRLIEVDSFGNRSSSHYKGTLQLYRLPRAELDGAGSGSGNKKPLGDPICRLPLTLPKKARPIE
ncbi:unnamed protein product [Knipowitschia caucasica]|uniref:Uncharacterized protein n=1 Tax=Knipowitschia caucasica TaxID=637954 RepID=A0AAV2J7A8_KNICA